MPFGIRSAPEVFQRKMQDAPKMLVADTLSCAHLPEVNSCIFFSGAGRG